MPPLSTLCFALSLLGLSWFGMMAIHEAGHAVAAVATGGRIERVVLHPTAISRTDVSPNPHPGLVVWAGPVVGVILPLALLSIVPRRWALTQNSAQFFAGFCLIANGAYIGLGAFSGVGDCGEMLRTGSPAWLLHLFGAICVVAGLVLWHRLGSPRELFSPGTPIPASAAVATALTLAVVVLAGLLWSPQ